MTSKPTLPSHPSRPAVKTCHPVKFADGVHVNHPAGGDGSFPAGVGTVVESLPLNSCNGRVYRVKCDASGDILPFVFEETELSAV